jgi:hypothetical protein
MHTLTLYNAFHTSSHALTENMASCTHTQSIPTQEGCQESLSSRQEREKVYIASHKVRGLHDVLMGELEKEEVQLTEQDQRKIRPHVIVQKRVREKETRAALEDLSSFEERPGKTRVFAQWKYEESLKWTSLQEFLFRFLTKTNSAFVRLLLLLILPFSLKLDFVTSGQGHLDIIDVHFPHPERIMHDI